MERGYIQVDRTFRTNVPGISAIGDVITFDKPGHPQLAHLSSAEGIALAERIAGQAVRRDQLRPGSRLHVLRSRDRQRRPDREGSEGARLRRQDRQRSSSASSAARGLPARSKASSRSSFDRKYDEILGVHMIGPAFDRAGCRSDAGVAPRVHGRRADSHDSRAPDDVGGGGGGRACGARGGDTCVTRSLARSPGSRTCRARTAGTANRN